MHDAVLVLANQEAAAATKVDQAKQANAGSRNVLQSIGLIGVDLSGPLAQANTDLKNAKPADATASAQKVMDSINSATGQGLLESCSSLVLILVLVGIALLVRLLRRRRRARKAKALEAGLTVAAPLDPAALDAGLVCRRRTPRTPRTPRKPWLRQRMNQFLPHLRISRSSAGKHHATPATPQPRTGWGVSLPGFAAFPAVFRRPVRMLVRLGRDSGVAPPFTTALSCRVVLKKRFVGR